MTGFTPCWGRRPTRGKNFGYRSRDPLYACRNALYELKHRRGISGDTCEKHLIAMKHFIQYLREHFGIRNLNHVEVPHVDAYFKHVAARSERGEMIPRSAINIMSAINVSLGWMRKDNVLKRAPGQFVKRARLCWTIRKNSQEAATALRKKLAKKGELGARLNAIIGLQRELGLRFEESLKLDCRKAHQQALLRGVIDVFRGTKGGQRRWVFATPAIIAALEAAIPFQADHDTLIPRHLSEATFAGQCYAVIRGTGYRFHANRHEWANDAYERYTGFSSPARYCGETPYLHALADAHQVSREAAIALDKEARLWVSEQLGHHRISITTVYLGPSRHA